jgi:glycosyltransferase involved in cell wall biosynthesis
MLTIHDLFPLINPELSLEGQSSLFENIKPNLDKIDRIIAVSQSTKNDIMKYLDVHEDKITMIYEGVDEKYKPVEDCSKIKKKYGVDKFILFVGTLEPRKNIPNLIKAFAKLNSTEYKLVITGKKGWKYKSIFNTAESLKITDKTVFTGYVPEDDLPALYSAADLFVYPSLYEGFGIPPLEAMACGTPVITSNRSSLPEVAGNAALLVDPEDTDELAEAMMKVIGDSCLRDVMTKRGFEQAKKFSWDQCVRKTIRVYKQIEEAT